jgi:RNA polymerase sigma factor (sigma-70 family)
MSAPQRPNPEPPPARTPPGTAPPTGLHGDPAEFAALHARLAPGLRALFRRRTRGRHDLADDLAQQTWSQVWQAVCAGRYDASRAAPSTFVYAVANHIWLQHCRAPQALPLPPSPADSAQSLNGVLEYSELLEALRACLQQRDGPSALDEVERRVVLELAEGASERELARLLGLAASTVHARKTSAYMKLRDCLAAKGYRREIVEQIDLSIE